MKKAILATLAYYDALGLPLTILEVWHYLVNPGRWGEAEIGNLTGVEVELEQMVSERQIETRAGFYFLPGRLELVEQRLAKQKIAEAKWKKVKRYLWLVQSLPYIEGLFASGSLGLGFMKPGSDLDILVITRAQRIWLGRLLLTAAMGLLGVRRRKNVLAAPGKVCLNHYIATDALSIRWHSLYTAQLYAHLWPVYLKDKKLLEDFNQANNWIQKDYLSNWAGVEINRQRYLRESRVQQAFGTSAERLLELTGLGWLLNQLAKKIQLARLARDHSDKGIGRITTTDQELEFHPHSPETAILDKYNETIGHLGQFGEYIEQDSGLRLLT
ncbi:MAG TPA: hypothetical protein VJZ52_00365 [Candidatus Paceibacterota bacterium]|nr:hypothetical protein [Candidatus Paceibacterota bacterium]